ncbi:MAG: gvpL2 [Solirubrobacterales bacterium]|nr:gvpL2 [Solirubrobacterales bacterium]
MPEADDARLARLKALLAASAAEDAAALLAEARDAAREEARSILQDVWREALLEAAAAAVEPRPPPERRRVRQEEGTAVVEPQPPEPRSVPQEGTAAVGPRPTEPRSVPQEGTAWWAYCVVPAAEADRVPPNLDSVDPSGPVEIVTCGELAAVVSRVPLSEYGDERLREHLEDLAWVERVARAHEEVLEAAMSATTIVPLRLCTIYLSRDRVEALLEDQAPGLAAALAELRGRTEWGVKVFAPAAAVAASASTEVAGGSAYIERKRSERAAREEAHQRTNECAQDVHARLEREAVAACVNPPQRREAHGRDAQMLLNGSYLFDDERRSVLESIVEALAGEYEPLGFSIELTGPWPPYNFVLPSASALS